MLRPRSMGMAVTVAALAALTQASGVASAAPAPPGASDPHNSAMLEVRETKAGASPNVANCEMFANKPNYSGNVVTGTGGIKSCTGDPVSCTHEVTLEVYLTPGWTPAASSGPPVPGCPPPARSSITHNYNCKLQSSQYSYRTETLGTLVDAEGQTDSHPYVGAVLNVSCL